jgi:hypothetical protein
LDFVVFPDLPFQCKSTQTTKLVAMSERASERAALVSSSVVAAGLVVVCSGFDVFTIACRPLRATTKKRKQETSEEF